jgi:hypothetical protein
MIRDTRKEEYFTKRQQNIRKKVRKLLDRSITGFE